MTANARKHIVAEMIGARMKTALSAAVGMMSSFSASLIPSAKPCSSPNGPTRFGPTRCCIRATTRRSAQIMTSVLSDQEHEDEERLGEREPPRRVGERIGDASGQISCSALRLSDVTRSPVTLRVDH